MNRGKQIIDTPQEKKNKDDIAVFDNEQIDLLEEPITYVELRISFNYNYNKRENIIKL